jgi:hypothetical protein
MKDIAILRGYDEQDNLVYDVEVSTHDYWDEDQIFDKPEKMKELKIVRIAGKLYNGSGKLFKQFETIWDKEGKYVSEKIEEPN